MKLFYSHLIEVDSIILELDQMDLSDKEKLHLSDLIDSSIHHAVLDAIFSQLSDSDKRAFVNLLNDEDHQKIWNFLNSRVDGIEDKIKKAADDLKIELHKDLKMAKSKRTKL